MDQAADHASIEMAAMEAHAYHDQQVLGSLQDEGVESQKLIKIELPNSVADSDYMTNLTFVIIPQGQFKMGNFSERFLQQKEM